MGCRTVYETQRDGYSCNFYVVAALMKLRPQHTGERIKTRSFYKRYSHTLTEEIRNMYTNLYCRTVVIRIQKYGRMMADVDDKVAAVLCGIWRFSGFINMIKKSNAEK